MQQIIKGIVDTQKTGNVSLGNTNAGDDTLIELTIKSNDVLLEYTNPTFQLLSKKSDNTKVRQIENITLEKGIIKIKCDTQTVLCQGLVTNQLYIVDGERISTVYFYFMVNPSLENEILEKSKDKIESLDKLDELLNVSFSSLDEYEQRLNDFGVTMNTAEAEEEKRKTNELLRLSTEKARILTEENRTANELSRLDNENVRTLNEETRVLTEEDRITNENNRRIAENTRIVQENTRVAAEGQRQSIFETNESIRNEQEIKRLKSEATRETKVNTWEEREGLRLVSEAQRREAENARVLTENERVAAENLRKEQEINRELTYNKFNAAELERVANEVTRGNNEEARNAAELLREQQENERIEAELTRNNRYDEAEATRNTNYNSSENTRQLSYQNSENTRNETFAAEELKRTNSYQDTENTRNNAFNQQEANRQSQYTAAERIRVENENLRKDNESNRVNSEEVRKSNEILRTSKETERVAAENIRITKESDRVSKENIRIANEDTRVSNENTRKTNETDRVSKESARVTNETARINAETTRGTKETARINAETARAAAEVTRVNSENTRVSNETTRGTNEIARVNAENIRIANETARQTVYKEIEENRKGYDNKVYPNMYEARKADYETLDNKFGDFTHSKFSGVGSFKADNTKEGLIKDFNIKGRTLQNLVVPSSVLGSLVTYYFTNKDHEKILKPNTNYTIVLFPTSPKINRVFFKQGVTTTVNLNSNNTALFTTLPDISGLSNFIHFYTSSDATLSEVSGTKVMLLEGDYTNIPISQLPYIEGIKSLGENEVNSASKYPINIKSCGKNLFDKITNSITVNKYYNNIGEILGDNDWCILDEFISVPSGVNLFINAINYPITFHSVAKIIAYDKDKKYISGLTPTSPGVIYTPNNAKFIKICWNYTLSNITDINKIQIEIGTVSTAYEPYQSFSSQQIELDEPLRSLPNGVCDEIVDNKLIRRVKRIMLNGNENWVLATIYTNTIRFTLDMTDTKLNGSIISDKLPKGISGSDYDLIDTHGTNSAIQITISKTKLQTLNAVGFKTWLSQNPTTVYYELATPIITDISNKTLKAYNKTTNVFMDNLLVSEISAKVPTDLTSEIEANRRDFKGNVYPNMYEARIRDTAYLLDKINNAEYLEYSGTNITANNSYDGLVKNLSVKGRTLQNFSHIRNFNCGIVPIANNSSLLKPNTKYTFMTTITNVANAPSGVWSRITFKDGTYYDVADKEYTNGFHKIVFTIPNKEIKYYDIGWIRNFVAGQTATMNDIMILEGDYTNAPLSEIPYIEGIKSVGELENKVSIKSCGKNLFDVNGNLTRSPGTFIDNNYTTYDGTYINSIANASARYAVGQQIKIKYGGSYTLRFKIKQTSDGEKAGVFVGVLSNYNEMNQKLIYQYHSADTSFTQYQVILKEIKYEYLLIMFGKLGNGTAPAQFYDIQLEENTVSTTYEPYQSSQQELTLTEPLRSLPNGICDEIIGDKLIRMVGKVALNGSEDWTSSSVYDTDNYKTFSVNPIKPIKNSDYNFINDRFIAISSLAEIDRESIWLGSGSVIPIRIKINKSKLLTPDLQGFKQWLQSNPTTVYYELATPTIETISPLILQSFDGATHITSDNYLLPTITAKVPSNVQAVVTNLMNENQELNNTVSLMSLESEENNLNNIETSLEQDMRLTMLELGL